jgi:serine/threonine protein kinase
LNYDLVEENEAFIVDDSPHRFCISTECPSLFLSNFLRDDKVSIENGKGIRKIISILLRIGESIQHLHEKGIIHGAISIASVGRFGNDWKLINLAGSRRVKSHFSPLRLGFAAPPGMLHLLLPPIYLILRKSHFTHLLTCYPYHHLDNTEAVDRVVNIEGTRYIFRTEVMATPAMDIWAFGKLSYELLSGHQLVNADSQHRLAKFLANWNDERLLNIIDDLEKSPAGPLAADLVFHCLSPNPLNRPRSMNDIMSHSFWR